MRRAWVGLLALVSCQFSAQGTGETIASTTGTPGSSGSPSASSSTSTTAAGTETTTTTTGPHGEPTDSHGDGTTEAQTGTARRIDLALPSNDTAAENLPIRVRLDDRRVSFAAAGTGGETLRFYAADGATLLPHDIERWDPPEAEVWVLLPRVSAGSDHFFMVYSAPDPPPALPPHEVWTAGHTGVWHLTGIDDASANAHDGAGNGTVAAPGLIAEGLAFDGESWVDLPTGIGTNTEGSVELWFRTDGTQQASHLFYAADTATGDGFGVDREIHVNLDGPPQQTEDLEFRIPRQTMSAGETIISSEGDWANDAWHHVFATWSQASGATMWIDGMPVPGQQTGVNGPQFGFGQVVRLGRPGEDTRYFTGVLDEVRLYGSVPSAPWIVLNYRSQTDALLSYGPEQAWP